MKFPFLIATLVLLASCGGESQETPDTPPANAAGSDVGTTGTDATAVPLAGDSTATDASHP